MEVEKGINHHAIQEVVFPITFSEVLVYHSQYADSYDGDVKGMVIGCRPNMFTMQARTIRDCNQNAIYNYAWIAIGK